MDSRKWNDLVQQQVCLAENSEGCTWSRLLLRSQRRQGSVKCSSQGHHWAWWCREFSENGLAAYKQAEVSVSGNSENHSSDHCPMGSIKLTCHTKGSKIRQIQLPLPESNVFFSSCFICRNQGLSTFHERSEALIKSKWHYHGPLGVCCDLWDARHFAEPALVLSYLGLQTF